MQRLLQGDVGSGKTAVALYTLLRAVEGGRQGALMAPTETLAEQHFLTIEGICTELGVRVALLTSSLTARERRAAHQLVASGDVGIAVGTHALIQREVEFADLAVAVVDEQHRFGVEQRAALTEGRSPHVLHMTATPIPRTLALTVYGDLAVSEIAAPPANRKAIITAWVTEERSAEAYDRLRRHLDDGRQAYVVCPLVEGSETTLARAAEDEAQRLRTNELRGYRVGCVHGRLKTAERRATMAAFTRGELDVLVATTVIEVGVDVPNATIMIVQEADRFGLAQLHQLRGRVGRGAEQSYCLLVSRHRDELSESALERLEAMVSTTDGFELAERDLEIRGEGQLVGARQSGLTDLRFTRLRADRDLLERAKELAAELEGEPFLERRRRTASRRGRARRRVLTTPGAARIRDAAPSASANYRCLRPRDTRSLPRRRSVVHEVALVGGGANQTTVRLAESWCRLGLRARLVSGAGAFGRSRSETSRSAGSTFSPGSTASSRASSTCSCSSAGAWRSGTPPRPCSPLTTSCAPTGCSRLQPSPSRARSGSARRTIGSRSPPHSPSSRGSAAGGRTSTAATPRSEARELLRRLAGRSWFRRHGALVQELVPPRGRDLRVLVAGGRVIGAAERTAVSGEWRTNVSLGGHKAHADAGSEAQALALAAARALGCDLVAVDLLPLPGAGFVVLELNAAADFDDDYVESGGDADADVARALGLPFARRPGTGDPPAGHGVPQRVGAG